MGRCGLLGCRMKANKENPRITLHQLPTCKKRKSQWLNILGIEKLDVTTKNIFICSRHFEEKHLNRTLTITRLSDDAVPSSELLPAQHNESLPNTTLVSESEALNHKALEEKPVCSTSNYKQDKALQIIQKLKSKCEIQTKKIKRLHEQVRRKSKKIADLKIIMKDIKDKNDANDYYYYLNGRVQTLSARKTTATVADVNDG